MNNLIYYTVRDNNMSSDDSILGVDVITDEIAEKIIFQKHETTNVDYKEKFHDDVGSWMEFS